MYYIFSFFLFTIHFFLLFLSMKMLGFNSEIIFEIPLGLNSSFDFSFLFLFDFYSMVFLSFVMLISSVVMVYMKYYMAGDNSEIRFSVLVLLFIISMGILILSPSLLSIMVGWDGLGVSSFLLVIYYMNSSSLRSGLITIYTNRFGDVAMILAFFYLFESGGSMLETLMGEEIMYMVFLTLMLGGMTKSAQIPFSSWLPAAMAAPTPVSSLVHSSTLVTAGVYLFFRFFYIFSTVYLSKIFCLVSLMTSFLAGLMACVEVDLKKLVAMSTLSQLGLMMFIVSMGDLFMCYFHMVSHALFKALLFLTCGLIILMSSGSQDMRFMGGLSFGLKMVFMMMLVSNLSLVGVPFLSGFFSKDLILEMSMLSGTYIFVMVLLFSSCVLSLIYSLKMIKVSMLMENLGLFSLSFFSFVNSLMMGILLGWSIFLGSLLSLNLFSGEESMIWIQDKLLGVLVLVGGFMSFLIMEMSSLKKNFFSFLFLLEMGYMNWFFGNFFSSGIIKIKKFSDNDFLWIELLLVKNVLSKMGDTMKSMFFNSLVMKMVFVSFLFLYLFVF